jgi:multiple sugar transport system substrate-binding protein
VGSGWDRSIDRRQFLIGGAIGTGALALAACGATGASSSPSPAAGGDGANLVLSSWPTTNALKTFKGFADQYHASHGGTVITVAVTPTTNFDEWMGIRLAGGQAPDIIRMQYQQAGRYIRNGGLLNIASYLPPGYGDAWLPTFWSSVSYQNGIYGFPHHTDTIASFYRADMLQQIGVTPPDTLANAWHWDEFLSILRKIKNLTGKYALSYGYSGANTAYRWLPLLYMHGGALIAPDGKTPAIDSPQGISALTWTQNLYKEGLIPPSNTIKGSTSDSPRQYFDDGTVGLMLHGDNQLVPLATDLKDNQWGLTYMVQDSGRASDLGGNILAVTKDCRNVKVAVEFLQFVCSPDNIQTFVTKNNYLPTLKSLSGKPLQYANKPEYMRRFVEQATTIPAAMAKAETLPTFGDINLMLADQLDLCFISQQTPAQTASAIASGLKKLLA